MKQVNLSNINANFLKVLDLLLEERNTTVVAEKLRTSQSAISYTLKQIRNIFDDDILIKQSFNNKMAITPLGKNLIGPVRNAVMQMENVVRLRGFDPKTSTRKFKISVGEYCLVHFIPELYAKIKEIAPNVYFEIHELNYSMIREQMEMNEFDFALGLLPQAPPSDSIHYSLLFKERRFCVVSKKHPALNCGRDLTLEEYNKYPHAFVRTPKDVHLDSIENYTKENKRSHLSIHSTYSAINLIADTDLIAFLSKLDFTYWSKIYPLDYLKPTFVDYTVNISLCQNKVSLQDKAITWMIDNLRKIISQKTKHNYWE